MKKIMLSIMLPVLCATNSIFAENEWREGNHINSTTKVPSTMLYSMNEQTLLEKAQKFAQEKKQQAKEFAQTTQEKAAQEFEVFKQDPRAWFDTVIARKQAPQKGLTNEELAAAEEPARSTEKDTADIREEQRQERVAVHQEAHQDDALAPVQEATLEPQNRLQAFWTGHKGKVLAVGALATLIFLSRGGSNNSGNGGNSRK
jgi:hypothetical protein